MPIEYRIDDARRLVLARGLGVVTATDVFGYQRDVWSRPEVAGFDELVDMSAVTQIVITSPSQIRELAAVSAAMDRPPGGGKLAIVAPRDLEFGLGRMYETFRNLETRGSKQVQVFRTWEDALAYLGVESALEAWT